MTKDHRQVIFLNLDLMSLFQNSFTPNPVAELLTVMYNVKDWLLPINPHLHNISNPHAFVLSRNTVGSVVLKYKHWSRDETWLPSDDPDEGLEILNHVCIKD